MSTAAVQYFTEREPVTQGLAFPATDALVAISGIKPEDHVLVIGRRVGDYLVHLARCCQAATGAHPDTVFMRRDAAEIVWITSIGEATEQVANAICKMPSPPRLVAIELVSRASLEKLKPFLRQLAAKGLVYHRYHQSAERLIVAASRPDWLRRVV